MTNVSAKMIHGMTRRDESLGHSHLVEVACEKEVGNSPVEVSKRL